MLFVCTGNIFRSLSAEHALRHALQARADIHVSSAGTDDFPHVVRPNVRDYLLTRSFDVSRHTRRTLTARPAASPATRFPTSKRRCPITAPTGPRSMRTRAPPSTASSSSLPALPLAWICC